MLLVLTPAQIQDAVAAVTRGEPAEDPNDLVANLLVRCAGERDVPLGVFAALYLLAHGVVKVLLVAGVLRDHLWACPWLVGFSVAFIGFQGDELVRHSSWGLVSLTLFDGFIERLAVREYQRHKQRGALRARTDRCESIPLDRGGWPASGLVSGCRCRRRCRRGWPSQG